MPQAWIGVAAARHIAIGVAEGFAMFAHGRHEAAARVLPGDWVAYYSPREGIDDGAPVRAFTAIGVALDGGPVARAMTPADTGWSRPMHWLDARPADVYPLLDRLSFIKDRRHWGIAFRRSLFSVSAADFTIVAEAMGAGDAFRQSA